MGPASGVYWWIHVSSILTYRRKKSFLPRLNSSKQRFELLSDELLDRMILIININDYKVWKVD